MIHKALSIQGNSYIVKGKLAERQGCKAIGPKMRKHDDSMAAAYIA